MASLYLRGFAPTERAEIWLSNREPDEDAYLMVTVELTINGRSIYRKFRTRNVSYITANKAKQPCPAQRSVLA